MRLFRLLLLFCCPLLLWAQPYKIGPGDTQRKQSYLLLRDGSVVRGQILRQDSTIITVQKRNRELTFVEADQLVRIMAERPSVDSPSRSRSGVPAGAVDSPGETVHGVPVQPVDRNRLFILKDGSQVEGRFVRRDSTMITVRKRNGQLTYFEPELLVRTDSVQTESVDGGNRTFPNRFSPYLLTGLTAYNPKKGRFYYRNTWLLLNEFQYGITRFWSVGAGFVTPVPYVIYTDSFRGVGGYVLNSSRLFTKLSVPIGNRFRLGVDASYRGNQQFSFFGLRDVWTLQALATVGSSQHNVTVGYGSRVPGRQDRRYSFYRTIPNQSFLTLGIMQKLSPGLTFVSDNTLYPGRTYFFYSDQRASVSAALRIDRRRHAFDLGVYSLIYEGPYRWDRGRSVRFFPYVGYNLLIGRD